MSRAVDFIAGDGVRRVDSREFFIKLKAGNKRPSMRLAGNLSKLNLVSYLR